jgi:hypothetical protein
MSNMFESALAAIALIGCGLVVYGTTLINVPLGFVVGGLVLVAVSVLIARNID